MSRFSQEGRRRSPKGYFQEGRKSPSVADSTALSRKRKPLTLWGCHWLFWLGLTMAVIVALIIGLTVLNGSWQTSWDDMVYGYPRTYKVYAVVGHNDNARHPSYFMAINLRGRIEIIELRGGDSAHAKIYVGPEIMGKRPDLTPVTLSFSDVNGDRKPDMLARFGNYVVVFINDGSSFRPRRKGEHIQLPS